MKIGIVTQPLGYNYGGILQNYALQQILKRLGFESITLDNYYLYSEFRFIASYSLSCLFNAIGKKRPYPTKPFNGRNIPKITGEFISTHIKTIRPNEALTEKTLKKYDIATLIVGSDQVWRLYKNKSIYNMYLDFAPSRYKKISYAASFGTKEWEYDEIQTSKCKQLLKQFEAVSVREHSGIDLVKNYLGYDNAKFVLDPTLLLNKSDYLSICSTVPTNSDRYLCAYILDKTDEKIHIINELASKKGLEMKLFTAHDELSLSVEEWISQFKDASFVITDSFHGTVFSIIFKRNFIVLPNQKRGIDRFISILSVLGLTDRIYGNTDNWKEPIQWGKVEHSLGSLRQDSINYLKDSLLLVDSPKQ